MKLTTWPRFPGRSSSLCYYHQAGHLLTLTVIQEFQVAPPSWGRRPDHGSGAFEAPPQVRQSHQQQALQEGSGAEAVSSFFPGPGLPESRRISSFALGSVQGRKHEDARCLPFQWVLREGRIFPKGKGEAHQDWRKVGWDPLAFSLRLKALVDLLLLFLLPLQAHLRSPGHNPVEGAVRRQWRQQQLLKKPVTGALLRLQLRDWYVSSDEGKPRHHNRSVEDDRLWDHPPRPRRTTRNLALHMADGWLARLLMPPAEQDFYIRPAHGGDPARQRPGLSGEPFPYRKLGGDDNGAREKSLTLSSLWVHQGLLYFSVWMSYVDFNSSVTPPFPRRGSWVNTNRRRLNNVDAVKTSAALSLTRVL